jgi:hypothetical protein
VVLITFTCPRNLRGFRRRLALTDRVLADAARAYGVRRAWWRRVWGRRTMKA